MPVSDFDQTILDALAKSGDKRASIEAAKAEKLAGLEEYRQHVASRTEAIQRQRESWVGQSGEELNTLGGSLTNLRARFVSGLTRMAGMGTTMATDLVAGATQEGNTPEEEQALARYFQDKASPEDTALVTTRPSSGRMSPLERANMSADLRRMGQAVRGVFDRSDVVDASRTNAAGRELKEGFTPAWDQTKQGAAAIAEGDLAGAGDLVTGLAKIGGTVGKTVANNGMAAVELAAENVPQLLSGNTIMAAANAGYALNTYSDGLQAYQEQNRGAVPDRETRREMAGWAATLALAEQVGDVSLVKGIRSLGLKKAGGEAVDAAAAEAARRTLGDRAKQVLLETLKGGGTEAATEGYQTFAEAKAKLSNASAEEIFEGAVMGGMAGGAIRGSTAVVQEALTSNPKAPKEGAPSKEITDLVTAAQKTGDVSALIDPKAKTYAPANAIAALERFSANGGDQVQQDALSKAGEVVAGLEAQRDEAARQVQTLSPEGQAASRASLAIAEAKGDTETAALIREELTAQEKDKSGLEKAEKELSRLDGLVKQSTEMLNRFSERAAARSTKIDVDAEISAINSSTDLASNQAKAASIINLSMAAPERVTDAQVKQLLSNEANGLSPAQRSYLRQFTDARVASNKLKNASRVGEEIVRGGNGNVGLVQYRRRVGAALSTGNRALADRHLSQLASFALSHRAKAQLMVEAKKEALETGGEVQVVRTADGAWEINRGPLLSPKQAETSGSPRVHKGTPDKWIAGVAEEADAITKTLNELTSAVALKFPAASTQEGGSDVTNVPQPRQVPAAYDGASGEPRTEASSGRAQAGPAGGTRRAEGVPGTDGPDASSRPGLRDAVDLQASPDAEVAPEVDAVEGQNQSTENAIETLAGAAPQSSESEERTSEDGGPSISAMAEKSEAGTAFNLRNLIADHFTQATGEAAQPLATTKDLLSGLQSDLSALPAAVQGFIERTKSWGEQIRANLPAFREKERRHYDVMQYLLIEGADGKPALDENVSTAISLAAFNWVASETTAPRNLLDRSINAILGKDKDARVSSRARELLGQAGTYQHTVADSLGGAVLAALGMQTKASAPLELAPKLRIALGLHALKLAEDAGLVTRTVIDGSTMAGLRGDTMSAGADKVLHQFIAIARQADGKPVAKAQEILETVKGTQGALDKFFGTPPSKILPSLEPIKQAQKTTSGTQQGVPDALASTIRKNQARPRTVVQDKLRLFEALSDGQINAIIGIQPTSSELTHKVNRAGQDAKNEGLRREYDQFMEWVGGHLATAEKGLETPFYLPFNVWKQQRVGIASNVVNPQTSKIVRFLVGSPEWKTTVDPSNPELMNSFWLRVAEGLGIKTERQDNALSIAEVQAKIAEPKFADAIGALRAALVDRVEISEDQKTSIVQAVGGDRLHALDVLIGVAYQQAAEGGPFEVQMIGEVDGVANGTMLNHVLMGAGSQAMLNQGGFFEDGNAHSQYNQWRGTPGNLDVYETTARKLFQKVAELFPAGSPSAPALASIWSIAGDIFDETTQKVTKDGRNLIKDALNPLAFGSAMERAVEGMSEAFLAKVYEQFEALAEKGAPQEKIDALVAQVNVLIDRPKQHIPMGKPISWHLDNVLSSNVEWMIQKNFISTVGMAVEEVVGNEFAPFLQRRNQLNAVAQASFTLSDAVYRGMRDAYVAELVEKGELFADDKGPLTDLTKAQDAELRKRLAGVMPVVETSMSQRDGDNTGLLMAKQERAQNKSRPYMNETKFGSPIKATGHRSTTLHGISSTVASPGVAMGSAQTHSLDSGISHDTQAEMDVLNIHDAVGAGVGSLGQAARLMNENTWKALLNYSPLDAQHQALARVVEGISGLVASGEISPQALKNLSDALPDLKKKAERVGLVVAASSPLRSLLASTKHAAHQADTDKLSLMKSWASVDQYAFQGGNYEVSAEDRAAAEKKLRGLARTPAKEAQEAAAAIEKAMKTKPAKGTSGAVPVAAAQQAAPEDRAETGTSEEFNQADDAPEVAGRDTQFGRIGEPTIQADPEILAFFQATPVAKAQDVVRLLNKVLVEKAGPSAGLMKSMLPLLMKTLPADMTMKLITADSNPGDVLGLPNKASVGWFVSDAAGKSEAYILSPDFQDSALQPEVLLHELVHGALARVIVNPDAQAKELVRELEALMTEARGHAQRLELAGFDDALSDVQEFVAYGLSNQAFQRQVLAQISLPSRTDQNTLVTGMRAFVDKVVGLLFRGSTKSQQEQAVNGMTVLIQNVSGLFAAANEAKAGGSINLSMAAAAVRDFSTLDIHAALNDGSVSPAFSQQIADVLGQVVQKLHGPFGTFKAALMQNQAQGPLDVWAKAVSTGKAPFASSVLASPLAISQQEAHAMEQVEATMREVLDSPDASARSVYRGLVELYNEMAQAIKPSDFNSQAEYDYVFKVSLDGQGRSDHLARFAAFGLANEQVNKLLQRATAVKAAPTKQTFSERLQGLFEKALEYLQERLTHTFAGQQADLKLKALVYQLVDIEGKKVAAIQRGSFLAGVGPLEAKVKQAADAAVQKVVAVAGSSAVRNSKNQVVRAAGSAVRILANNQVDAFVEAFTEFRNKSWDERLGFVAGTLNYAMGANKVFERLLRESKRRENIRKGIITSRSKMAREMFANKGKDITKQGSAAITRVFLRTGLHLLTDRLDMQQIEKLLGDRNALSAEIKALEQQLSVYGAAIQAHFINKANTLGYFKATGDNVDEVLMMNAHSIARLYGTRHAKKNPLSQEQIDAAEAVIEQLVALNALSYVPAGDVRLAKEILARENQRAAGEGHGIAAVLALHKHLAKESRERLFQWQEALMQHGHTPEILNPHNDVKTATAEEGAELEGLGYTKLYPLKKDPADPDLEPRALYIMRDGGLNPLVTGAISYTGKAAKGTKKHSGFLNPNTENGLENASTNADVLSAKPTGLATGPKRDFSKGATTYMAPILNPQGEIVNWRYMMNDKTRDDERILGRDNSFDKLLGVMAGSIFDKETTTEINTKVLEALQAHYDSEGAKHPQSYVLIGPDSPDEEAREIWARLPYETRKAVRDVWGSDGMYVQRTLQDIVFGYRKLSLADAVKNTQERRELKETRAAQGLKPLKPKGMQEQIEQGLADLFTALIEYALRLHGRTQGLTGDKLDAYAMRAASKVAQGERVWQELVQETKDLIVVKSITVLVGNIRSNLSLLVISGVPLKDILRDHLVALRGATAFQKDSEELDRIQTLLDAGLAGADEAKLRRQVVLLKDSLARNPVRELIDAGLMPSIVEDTSEDDDIYSYKSKLVRASDKLVSKVHPMVRRAANEIYMRRDTKAYQGLRRFTQLSDFMARYTQYQHLTTRKENPLSKEDAIQQASDDFVNYDIPMHRNMQYLDDMGIFMFSKYFLRIQKVIMRLTKEKPGRVLSAVALDQFMSLGPIVLDSSWVGRVGNNPLSWGALQYPGSIDELATVSAGMALVK